MTDTAAQPRFGDRVTYIDSDGIEQYAIVLEPIPDQSYVTLAVTRADPRQTYIGPSWETETSVNPHTSLNAERTASTHAFKRGWD